MKAKKITGYCFYFLFIVLLFAYFSVNIVLDSPLHPIYRTLILVFSCAMAYIGSVFLGKAMEEKKSKALKKATLFIIFLLYLLLVFTLTWADEFFGRAKYDNLFIWDLSQKEREIYLKTGLQRELFATVKRMFSGYAENRVTSEFLIMNILGNIMLLMPLGYFLPKLFKKQKNTVIFMMTVLLLAVLIEGVQLILMIGVCDIDDLLLNISGAFMVFFMLKLPILGKCLE